MKAETAAAVVLKGAILNFLVDRGFGFIRPSDGGKDVFVRVAEFPEEKVPKLGRPVEFEIELDPQGRRRAVRVRYAMPSRRADLG